MKKYISADGRFEIEIIDRKCKMVANLNGIRAKFSVGREEAARIIRDTNMRRVS